MILLDLINWKKVRKALLYVIVIVLATWLQTMVLSRAVLFGVAPFFLPALAVAIGMWEGGGWGGALGMAAGYYCDMCCTDYTLLFLVMFTFIGFGAGMMVEFFINRSYFSFLLIAVAALVITAVCQAVPVLVFQGTALGPLVKTVLLQTLWSIPFAAVLYPVIKIVAAKQRRR